MAPAQPSALVETGAPSMQTNIEDLHHELSQLAAAMFSGERPGHTLQPTALVNELWLRLLADRSFEFRSRPDFLAWASVAIRHVLVDHARRRNALKRGGGSARHSVQFDIASMPGVDILELDDALHALERQHPRSARVVEMIYFGGMTHAEAAQRLGVTDRTIRADWSLARAWLYRTLGDTTRQ